MIARAGRVAALAGGLVTLIITLLVSYDVLMRYFLDAPQLFVDELASYLQILIVFGGLAYTFEAGGHVRVDLFTARMRPERRARMRVLTLALSLAVILVVAWVTARTAWTAFDYGRVSAVMLYPLWLPMVFIPLGLALFAVSLLSALARQVALLRGAPDARDEVKLGRDNGQALS